MSQCIVLHTFTPRNKVMPVKAALFYQMSQHHHRPPSWQWSSPTHFHPQVGWGDWRAIKMRKMRRALLCQLPVCCFRASSRRLMQSCRRPARFCPTLISVLSVPTGGGHFCYYAVWCREVSNYSVTCSCSCWATQICKLKSSASKWVSNEFLFGVIMWHYDQIFLSLMVLSTFGQMNMTLYDL